VRLVLFAFPEGHSGAVEVIECGESLDALGDEIPVGHRMTDDRDAPTPSPEDLHEASAHRPLAASGPHGRDGDDRSRRAQHGSPRPEQREVRAGGQGAAGEVHDVLVTHIALGEDRDVHAVVVDKRFEGVLRLDRDASRIARSRQLGGVTTARDAGDLGGGEGNGRPGRRR
jgi:hypothetical protein